MKKKKNLRRVNKKLTLMLGHCIAYFERKTLAAHISVHMFSHTCMNIMLIPVSLGELYRRKVII